MAERYNMNLNHVIAKSISKANQGIEKISMTQAADIAKIDGAASSNIDKYVEGNTLTIYTCGNCWISYVDEVSVRSAYYLKRRILAHGLIASIKEADEIATAIIHEESDLTKYTGFPVWSDALQQCSLDGDFGKEDLQLHVVRTMLEVLRFPKRYSPAYQDDVLKSGLDKFLELNKSRKYKTYDPNALAWELRTTYADNHCVRDIYDVVSDWIAGTPLDPGFWGFEYSFGYTPTEDEVSLATTKVLYWANYSLDLAEVDEVSSTSFTEGATAELSGEKNTYLQKLWLLRKAFGCYKSIEYPWSNEFLPDSEKLSEPGFVKAVPKSYKTPRIIVKEPLLRNYIATGLRIETIKALRSRPIWKQINVESQDRNRQRAWESAMAGGKFSTEDYASASDSIAMTLGIEIFPIFKYLPWLRDTFIAMDAFKNEGSKWTRYTTSNIFLTSGHPLTFLCETLLIEGSAVVATEYTQWIYSDKRYHFMKPISFGDDLLVDNKVHEMIEQVAASIGMTINVDKSFSGDSAYRESCGEEYLNGYPMHGVKWPRTTFDWSRRGDYAKYVTSLVTLQQALYSKCWVCEEVLRNVITSLVPSMTSSPGFTEDSTDLWSDVDMPEQHIAPMGVKGKDDPQRLFDELPEHVKPYALREIHSIPQSYVQLSKAEEHLVYDRTLETALYVDFLMKGPRYASPLDELLHISSPVDRRVLVKRPKQRWVKVLR